MKKIVELAKQVLADSSRSDDIVREFIAKNQFPLMDNNTATFFYFDGEPADTVTLMHWVFGLESRQPFRRLSRTNAWFLPVELPGKGRIEYKIEVKRGGSARWVHDPHNPHRAYDPFGSNSVCLMPGYHNPNWVMPETGVRTGTMESFEVRSAVYGGTRKVQVYLPNEYKPNKSYPLILCHDGSDYLRFSAMKTVLDNLIHRKEVIPLVVAFVDGHARNQEYAANPKQPKFLVEEVLPEIEKRYGVTRSPRKRGLMGASFGGVSSLYTAWSYPGVFGRLLLQSGSFAFTDIGDHDRGPLWDPVVEFVNQFRQDPAKINAKVFMSCGTFESLIYYNRSLVPLLQDAGLQMKFVEAQDGHNWVAWRDRLRDGLSYLFPGHLWMYYD